MGMYRSYNKKDHPMLGGREEGGLTRLTRECRCKKALNFVVRNAEI